jgi:hypothetical protein
MRAMLARDAFFCLRPVRASRGMRYRLGATLRRPVFPRVAESIVGTVPFAQEDAFRT